MSAKKTNIEGFDKALLSTLLEKLSDGDISRLAQTSRTLRRKINEWDAEWEKLCEIHFPKSYAEHKKTLRKVRNVIGILNFTTYPNVESIHKHKFGPNDMVWWEGFWRQH